MYKSVITARFTQGGLLWGDIDKGASLRGWLSLQVSRQYHKDEDDILAVMNMTELCAFLCMSRCLASPALKNNTTHSMCNKSTVHPQTGTKRTEFISASPIRMAALYCISEPAFPNGDMSSTHYFKHMHIAVVWLGSLTIDDTTVKRSIAMTSLMFLYLGRFEIFAVSPQSA